MTPKMLSCPIGPAQWGWAVVHDVAHRAPRFVYLSDENPGRPAQSLAVVGSVAWRILAANNRPLARSVRPFPSLAECVESAIAVKDGLATATKTVAFDPVIGLWRWQLSLGESPVATCVHSYRRRVECVRALTRFERTGVEADPHPPNVRRLGSRAMRDYQVSHD
jgi:hypothetical protein